MVRCPGCDTVNPDGVSACKSCGTAIGLACARCGAGNPALARFCCGCGSRLEPAADDEAPASLSTPERRQMTVLFCDVVGSTALARHLDPEDWHRLIHRVHSKCDEIIARHHGHVAQLLGDGLLAYFGYPVATDDAPRQAVKAGLELASEIAKIEVDASHGLNVRVGIHTGPVIVGNVGSKRHQESLALGETPSLAARIQEVVPAGALVVSPETQHLIEGFFTSDELGTYELKGFPEPRALYRVLSERGPITRLEAASVSGLTPLVGREVETAKLAKAWEAALARVSSAHLVVGEAGIGKSRLIHTLKERAVEAAVPLVELRCSEYARSSAFYPVIECLQREIGLRHGDPTDTLKGRLLQALEPTGLSERQVKIVAALLGVPLEVSDTAPPQQLRAELLEALSVWIRGPDSRSRLIIVEDLHWADPSMLELISTLVGPSLPAGKLVLLSARPEFAASWTASGNVATLTLGRLGSQETRELLEHIAGGKSLPREVSDRIAVRAEGIPLFLEEMTRSVVESGILEETNAGYVLSGPVSESTIPATLHDSLMGRLDQLGHGKPVAQLAAVLGREFSFALFEAVWRDIPSAPRVNLGDGLERLVRAQLLTRTGERPSAAYEFKHSLLQDAAYQSLLRSRRREYHQFTAKALVKHFPTRVEQEPELVAYHYSCAQKSQEALEYWNKAGQRAIGASAYAEAITHFGAGLEQLAHQPPGEERARHEIDIRSRLAVALITTRGFSSKEVEENCARATELCEELGDEIPIRVLYGTWAVNLVRGDLAGTNRMVPIFERLTEAPTASARLVAHAALATWAFWRGDYPRSIRHASVANGLCDAEKPREQHMALLGEHGFEGLLYSALYLAWSQALTGDAVSARKTWTQAAEMAERIGDPYLKAGVFAFGGLMHHDLGDAVIGFDLGARTLELCLDKGFVAWHVLGTVNSGYSMLDQGKHDEAVATIQGGLNLCRMIGAKTGYSYYSTYLTKAHLARGEVNVAIAGLEQELEATRTNVERNFEPELLRLLGDARLARGDTEGAKESFTRALEIAQSQGALLLELRVATSLSRLLAAQGENGEAKRVITAVREKFPASTELASLAVADEILTKL